MGFRSTFVTDDRNYTWPSWFIEKYRESVYFNDKGIGAISSKFECKTYFTWADLAEDIQKAMDWDNEEEFWSERPLILVYLHECGGITRVQISKDAIQYTEPVGYKHAPYCLHGEGCYVDAGCSDAKKAIGS